MKLHRLHLTNFKGARDVVFEPNGHDADVYSTARTRRTGSGGRTARFS